MTSEFMGGGRRTFLRVLGAGAVGLALGQSAESQPLRGVFPIGQTPFTESDKLDLECLQAEVKFCNRYRVHGFVWPQIASNWTTLSDEERMEGAEAILAAGKSGQTTLVIGVQTQGADVARSVRLARHAARNGAGAIISLPPEKAGSKEMIAYYQAIGAATGLPLIVQSQGDMSVDLIVDLFHQIPTVRCVKDEAGNPLARVTEILRRTNGELAVFSGNGVRTMIDEMRLGFSGHCPFTALADFYAAAFDQWHAGKRREAFETFGRILAMNSIPGASSYLLVVRGVFRETTRSRGSGPGATPLDEAGKKAVRVAWDEFMKPYVRVLAENRGNPQLVEQPKN